MTKCSPDRFVTNLLGIFPIDCLAVPHRDTPGFLLYSRKSQNLQANTHAKTLKTELELNGNPLIFVLPRPMGRKSSHRKENHSRRLLASVF